MSRTSAGFITVFLAALALNGCDKQPVNVAPKAESLTDHQVAHSWRVEEMRRRIATGIDVNSRNDLGQTLLYVAVKGAHIEMIELLLDAGARINGPQSSTGRTVLFQACFDGYHVDLTASAMLQEPDRDAAPFVDLLIARGADVNEQDHFGATALHAAVAGNNLHVVRILLERGADPTLVEEAGKSPLDYAIESKFAEIIDLLCHHSPNLIPCASGSSVP